MTIPKISEEQIASAARIIRDGGIILYPTDTSYGLGCNWQNENAQKRIMKLKRRIDPRFTLIAGSQEQVEWFFALNACQQKLARAYWPGAVSIVVNDQYAVRVPKYPEVQEIALRAKTILLATSANRSGDPDIYSLNIAENPDRVETLHDLCSNVDFVIDVGILEHRKPSTIVQCVDNAIKILRE